MVYMSKAILVIDMPEMCIDCDFSYARLGIPYCYITEERLESFRYKPNWCPLKPIPDKYDMSIPVHDRDYTGDYEYGYNACIDEILGVIK